MEFWLFNQDLSLDRRANRGTVVVKTKNPQDLSRIHDITVAIRCKLRDMVRFELDIQDWEVVDLDQLASLPPDTGDSGCEFYVHTDSFALLKGRFVDTVWGCIRDLVGDELD